MMQTQFVNESGVINFVNQIIEKAIKTQASDIHVENYETICRIRLRCDGLLQELTQFPKVHSDRILARLKILARLDIAEKRQPQDGRFKFMGTNKQSIDIRVSSCPTLFGEKMVLRLLNSHQKIRVLNELNFSQKQLSVFEHILKQPQGLILVTGPTGSGKTTTLYSALHFLNDISKNISTVEDPVEIQLPGINQVAINPKANINFSNILRAFLRQDPDIIMVGEIRDLETAEIAIKAAQTGHLVLSTLHTNNAEQAIVRLQQMGIAEYHLKSAITMITAQRLLRGLCDHCKYSVPISPVMREKLKVTQKDVFYEAKGCEQCVNGFHGRFAIHEILGQDKERMFYVEKNNLQSLAFETLMKGKTSLSEIYRVLPISIRT